MNEIKPVIGIENNDKYKNAELKFMEFVDAFNKLNPVQQEHLVKEIAVSAGMAVILGQFIRFMNNGGQR